MRQFTCPKAVTHPSTNRALCRATALIETNALPLHQTATPYTNAKTCCNVTYQVIMLERLLEQRDAVTLVLTTTTAVKNLNAQQWATARDLASTLQPFLDVTKEMSAAAYPTASMIIPIVDGLRHLLQATTGGLDVLRAILLKNIDDRFGHVFADEELRAATTVDPRFKVLSFEGDDREKAVDATINFMAREDAVNTGASQTSSSASAGEPTPASSLWAKLNAAKSSNAVSASSATNDAASRQILNQQLATYLAEPTLPHSENPLFWWAANRHKYPSVAAVARRLLAVPATSVASERLFSKAGNVITKKRNRLLSAKADSVVFCMENL